jgi:hypothetical protein
MLEKTIVKRIVTYLKTLDECFFWKEHGGQYGTSGIPDIICCYKGKFVAFEVKNETGKLSALQSVTLKKIKVAGGVAVEVRSLDEVKKIIEKVDNGGDYDS